MNGPYADHVLDARDVCSNCFRIIRVERLDPVRGELGTDLDSRYARHRRNTSVDFHDGVKEPAHSKGVYCKCGVEGSHERLWAPDDVDRDRFKSLLKEAVRTVEHKGVALERKETLRYALAHFRDHGDVDQALATALDAGVVAAVASEDPAQV